MDKKNQTAQIALFNKIKDLIGPTMSLVDEVADILKLSTDSTYRRIRNETSLSFDEALMLCNHFKISLDEYTGTKSNNVTFQSHLLFNDEENIINYFTGLNSELASLEKLKEAKIIWAATDIPIFHHFSFPELTAFKLFYWMRSINSLESLSNKKFDPALIKPEIIQLTQETLNYYQKVSSTEIWTDNTLNSILKQIEHYWVAEVFNSKEQALLICQQLEEEISHIRLQAEFSSKFPISEQGGNKNNFTIFYSEIELGNNTILISSDHIQKVYLTHHTYNSLSTLNKSFCNETAQWMDVATKKSTLISGIGEKQRHQYFKQLHKKIDALLIKIKED